MNVGSGIKPIKQKWHSEIDAQGLSELAALAKDINKTVDTTVKQVARGKIRVGKLLLEARALFNADQDFGKWRVENTLVQSKQHAHYLMQVADRFGDAVKLIDGANYSIMQELVLADQADIDWVEERIDAGDAPTKDEVREHVKETKGTSKKGLAPSGSSTKPTVATRREQLNAIVKVGLTMRIKQVVDLKILDITGDYLILGLDPDPQTPMHHGSLQAIFEYWIANSDDDEQRAVRDSFRRIKEEFKHWDTT